MPINKLVCLIGFLKFWSIRIMISLVLFKQYKVRSFVHLAGLGSNTFYQIQIQIQIQKFGFFKYKYKYKYFLQPWFKYKYKYKYIHSNTNTNTNTFNQIYLPKLFRIQNREILQIPRCMLMACVSLCLGDTWSLPLCISGNFTGTRAVRVGWG